MQKASKVFLNSLKEHSACTASTEVKISVPAASTHSFLTACFKVTILTDLGLAGIHGNFL